MHLFFVSAKTGDSVNACFARLAAGLAGVTLSKADESSLDGALNVVTATIVNHDQHDTAVNNGQVPQYTKTGRSCAIS